MKWNITIEQIKKIQAIKEQKNITIWEYKMEMKKLAEELWLSDMEILEIARWDF